MARGGLYRLLSDAYKGHVTKTDNHDNYDNHIMAVFSRNFFECLQPETKSFLLFRMDMSDLQIMKYFSHKHRLHSLLTFEYDFACFTLRHLMVYVTFLFFKLHKNDVC